MKRADEWWWVIYRRRDSAVLACASADYTSKQELRDLTPQYKSFPCRLVRGAVGPGHVLTSEQICSSFPSISEALSHLQDAALQVSKDEG